MTRAPRVYLETLGCEKNLVDSQAALGLLLGRGFVCADEPDGADLIVLNTCGFLQAARAESLDRIGELAQVKGSGKLVVMGCFIQGGTHSVQEIVPEVDHVLGVGQYRELASLLDRKASAPPLADPSEAPYAGYGVRVLTGVAHVAHIKIAEGCNQSCAFCKIPMLRGKQRSRPVEDIVEEARGLAARGVKEIILIAQNTSSYGIDLEGRPRLGQLCRALARLEGIEWIRVLYAYPPMFTDRLVDEVYEIENVVSYLDIPIQHASPRILEAMNRGYDPDDLRRRIERLRQKRPDIMLRSTVLLGFPGEQEEDVEMLLDFLAELRFDHLGTFVYSREEQTAAYPLDETVDEAEKEDRRARVQDLQWDLALASKTSLLGRSLDVMVDEIFDDPGSAGLFDLPLEHGKDPRKGWAGRPVAFARSEGFCLEIDGGIWLPGEGLRPGDRTRVTPVACGPYDVWAVPMEPPEGIA